MSFSQELSTLLAAQVPYIHLVTYEEDRVLRTLTEIAQARNLGVVSWDKADDLIILRQGAKPFPLKFGEADVTEGNLLRHVDGHMPSGYVLVLKDFHHTWNQERGGVTRKLRNLAAKLSASNRYVVFVTPPLPPAHDLPQELKDDVALLNVPFPDEVELTQLFNSVTEILPPAKRPDGSMRARIVQAALGLTTTKARRAFLRAYATHQQFDVKAIDLVTAEKQQIIRESGALEFWPASKGEADVGGLDLLKDWLYERELGFSEEARAQGMKYPKGVLLIGIPGTGKSLCAKMISSIWKQPLLRLDIGALFASYVGESELNLRKALMIAEAVSPCIVWIDELEKGFSGSNSRERDGGTSSRVLSTFLTWMQERRKPVFIFATANDISGLPPEFLRKGRFDDMFFLDLPNDTELKSILLIHLRHARIAFPERTFRMDELVAACRGMVGSDIEAAVDTARFKALANGGRQITQADLLAALEETVSFSKSHPDLVRESQSRLKEQRVRPASKPDTVPPPLHGPRRYD